MTRNRARSSTPLPFATLARAPAIAALNVRETLALLPATRIVEDAAPPPAEATVYDALRRDSLALQAWRINALARRCYPRAFRR